MNYFEIKHLLRWVGCCIGIAFLIGPIRVNAQTGQAAGDVEVTAEVSRDVVQIADPFDLNIQVIAPDGTRVSFPEIKKTLGPFEIIKTNRALDVPLGNQANQSEGQRLWRLKLSLETLDTGRLEIPPIEIAVQLPGQSSQIRRTQPIPIEVASIVEPNTELTQFQGVADLHDVPVPASKSNQGFWLATIAGAIVLALAGGAFFLKQRTSQQVAAKVWALRKLKVTRDLNEAESIVRQFIDERFGFPAKSMPIDQVLTELNALGIDESLAGVKELLETSERVKFGGLDVSGNDTQRLLSLATEVVEGLDSFGGQA